MHVIILLSLQLSPVRLNRLTDVMNSDLNSILLYKKNHVYPMNYFKAQK